jgi:hypothetical protein
VQIVVLADGSRLVERDGGALDLAGLEHALVQAFDLEPPYRVEAVRRSSTAWAAGARSIAVAELPETVRGDEIELVWDGRERSMRVDGAPGLGSVPQLESLARQRYDTWIVRASRLRERLWEVEIDPL